MSETYRQREPSGLGPALMLVIFLIVAIAVGGVVVVYRQARAARAQADEQRLIAAHREREIRQIAEMQMKQLADLEAKEGVADAAGAAPTADTDPQRIADLHTALGNAYLAQGERKKAVEQFAEAVEVLKKAFGEGDARVTKAQELLKKAQEPGG